MQLDTAIEQRLKELEHMNEEMQGTREETDQTE
jgi:hypothetical protein